MRHDELYLWFLADPATPRYVGQLRLVDAGKGASLQYGAGWLSTGFPLSEDLPLVDIEQLPRWKGIAVGAVDDARPDRWGERVIQYLDKPARLSIMEYLFYAGDDRFGALGASTSAEAYLPRTKGPLPRLEQAQQLSEVVRKVNNRELVNDIERRMLTAGGSFGGAKPKALIDIAGEQWVIKFFDNEPIDVPRIEHASSTQRRCVRSTKNSGRKRATTTRSEQSRKPYDAARTIQASRRSTRAKLPSTISTNFPMWPIVGFLRSIPSRMPLTSVLPTIWSEPTATML